MIKHTFTEKFNMEIDTLLLGLRTSNKYTKEDVARETGMPLTHYVALEEGAQPIKIADAQNFGTLYKIDAEIFLQQRPKIINNNFGHNSKGVIYATNYYEGLNEEQVKTNKPEIGD